MRHFTMILLGLGVALAVVGCGGSDEAVESQEDAASRLKTLEQGLADLQTQVQQAEGLKKISGKASVDLIDGQVKTIRTQLDALQSMDEAARKTALAEIGKKLATAEKELSEAKAKL